MLVVPAAEQTAEQTAVSVVVVGRQSALSDWTAEDAFFVIPGRRRCWCVLGFNWQPVGAMQRL